MNLLYIFLAITSVTSNWIEKNQELKGFSDFDLSSCSPASEVLQQLSQLFQKAETHFDLWRTSCELPVTPQPNFVNSLECKGINNIKENLQNLPFVLQTASNFIILNYTEHAQLLQETQASLNYINLNITSFLDSTEDDLLVEDFQSQLNYFNCLLSNRFKEIQLLADKYQEQIISLITALIYPSQNAQAQVVFYQQNNNSLITPVMESLYKSSLNFPYFDYTAAFTLMMQTRPQRISAFIEWFRLVTLSEDLLSNGIVIMHSLVSEELSNGDNPELNEMKAKLEVYEESVITRWARLIQTGNSEEVAKFGSPGKSHVVGNIFGNLMEKILSRAIGDDSDENFMNCLVFIDLLGWNIHKYQALKYLFDNVDDRNSNRKFLISLKVKDAMENLAGPDSKEEALEKFRELVATFPENMQSLLWKPSCYLRNRYIGNSNYFYCKVGGCFTLEGLKSCGSLIRFDYNVEADGIKFALIQADSQLILEKGDPDGGDTTRSLVKLVDDPIQFNWRIVLGENNIITIFHETTESYPLTGDFRPGGGPEKTVHVFTAPLNPPSSQWELIECI